MLQKLKSGWAHVVSHELRRPTKTLLGRFIARRFQRHSAFLEKGAVKLLNIQPDDKVLEIGFGGGVGLRTAYWRVKEGSGVIFGAETSQLMLQKAEKFCALEIAEGKVHVCLASVTNLPFPDSFFDRVFHCNSYYYWNNLILAAAELQRVMKPGALMVATLSLDDLKTAEKDGYLQDCNPDPLDYMHSLETVGFEQVHVKYMTGSDKMYQGIFATKPRRDELTAETLEEEEERFRKAMSEIMAAKISRLSHTPVAPDFDPLQKKAKSDTKSDDPAIDQK